MQRAVTRAAAAGAALLLAALVGCSSVSSELGDSLDLASSATSSAAVAMKLYGSGRAIPALTDTVLNDALAELDDAQTALGDISPTGTLAESRGQERALSAVRGAIDAVLAARNGLVSGEDPDMATDRLTDAIDELRAAAKQQRR